MDGAEGVDRWIWEETGREEVQVQGESEWDVEGELEGEDMKVVERFVKQHGRGFVA